MSKEFSIKNLKEDVLHVMDEEEKEIERNISESEEGVDKICESKEQVDDIRDSKEGVDCISDSDERVDTESEEKAYREYVFRNEFETMNVFEQENNLGRRINQYS